MFNETKMHFTQKSRKQTSRMPLYTQIGGNATHRVIKIDIFILQWRSISLYQQ